MKRLASLAWGLVAAGCATTTTDKLHLPPLETVAHVDLERYVGTWFEIASFPQRFQRLHRVRPTPSATKGSSTSSIDAARARSTAPRIRSRGANR